MSLNQNLWVAIAQESSTYMGNSSLSVRKKSVQPWSGSCGSRLWTSYSSKAAIALAATQQLRPWIA